MCKTTMKYVHKNQREKSESIGKDFPTGMENKFLLIGVNVWKKAAEVSHETQTISH